MVKRTGTKFLKTAGKKTAMWLLVLVFLWTGTSCGKDDTTSIKEPEAVVEVQPPIEEELTEKEGEILQVGVNSTAATLDPQYAADREATLILASVMDGLYTLDEENIPAEALADSVKESGDGLTYTFKLKDAVWSDGTEVTAADFVFAWGRLADQECPNAWLLREAGIKNAAAVLEGEKEPDELGITAVDEKTLELKLDIPCAFIKQILALPAFYPVREEFYNSTAGNFGEQADTVLTNGVFLLGEYTSDATEIRLVQNGEYYGEKAELKEIEILVFANQIQAQEAYDNGEIDLYQASAGALWYLVPNREEKTLRNSSMRKALAVSYDKNKLAENLEEGASGAGYAVPMGTMLTASGEDFRMETGNYLSYNKKRAAAYLEKAKKKLEQKKFSYTILTEDWEEGRKIAAGLKEEMEGVLKGVTIEIETVSSSEYARRLLEGDFQLALVSQTAAYGDPMSYLGRWTTNNPANYGGWTDKKYDAMIESCILGEYALDVEERWKALKEAEKLLLNKAAIFPVCQTKEKLFVKPGISGIQVHKTGVTPIFTQVKKESAS